MEQVYLPSDSRLDLLGERLLFELDCDKWGVGGGGNVGTIHRLASQVLYQYSKKPQKIETTFFEETFQPDF